MKLKYSVLLPFQRSRFHRDTYRVGTRERKLPRLLSRGARIHTREMALAKLVFHASRCYAELVPPKSVAQQQIIPFPHQDARVKKTLNPPLFSKNKH